MAQLTAGACWRDLHLPLLGSSMMERLAHAARSILDERRFWSDVGYETSEEFADIEEDIPELAELAADCVMRCKPLLMYLPPLFTMDIHRDVHYMDTRQTCISAVVLPDLDMAETLFYESETDAQPVQRAKWSRGQVRLLNIQQWHNVRNGAAWRANLQLSLPAPYDEVIYLIEQGKLFRNHACSLVDRSLLS